jgi:alkylhydroperoxidase family enzyme
MTWLPIAVPEGSSERDAVFELVPEVKPLLDEALDAARSATDQELLTRCRERMVQAFGGPEVEPRDDRERAAFDFVDQFVLDGSGVTEQQVAALNAHFETLELINFVHALHMVEAELRVLTLLEVAT